MSNTIEPIKNFSDIPKITEKDQLINDWIDQTGLPKETVNNLFEHFSLQTDGSLTAINESFTQHVNKRTGFSWERFRNNVLRIGRDLVDPDIRESKRVRLTNDLLATIKTEFGIPVDAKTLTEVLCAILLKRNPNFDMRIKSHPGGYDFNNTNNYTRTTNYGNTRTQPNRGPRFASGADYTRSAGATSSPGPQPGETAEAYRARVNAERAKSRYGSENTTGKKPGAKPGSKYGSDPTNTNKRTGSIIDDMFNKFSSGAKKQREYTEADRRADEAEKARTEAAQAERIRRENKIVNEKLESNQLWLDFFKPENWTGEWDARRFFLYKYMEEKKNQNYLFYDAKTSWENMSPIEYDKGVNFWQRKLDEDKEKNSFESETQQKIIQDIPYQQVTDTQGDYEESYEDKLAELVNSQDFDVDEIRRELEKRRVRESGNLNESENLFFHPELIAQEESILLLEAMDFTPFNVTNNNTIEENLENSKHLKNLYESLKDMLNKRRNDFTTNRHLSSRYEEIMSYLDNEIDYLVNYENVVTIDSNYHLEILNEFIKNKYPNPIYRNHNSLKTLVSDTQTLVFDLLVLINHYVNSNMDVISFISKNTLVDYQKTLEILYSQIQTSKHSSRILCKNSTNGNLTLQQEISCIDNTKLDVYTYPVTLQAALNMVHTIKALSIDFNLKIRPLVNLYITKTVELLVSTEKKIIAKNNAMFK